MLVSSWWLPCCRLDAAEQNESSDMAMGTDCELLLGEFGRVVNVVGCLLSLRCRETTQLATLLKSRNFLPMNSLYALPEIPDDFGRLRTG